MSARTIRTAEREIKGARPVRAPSGRRGGGLGGAQGGAAFGITLALALVALAIWAGRSSPASAPPRPAALNPWVPIDDPIPLFDLPGSRFKGARSGYEAWRARDGAGRRDILTFGAFDADGDFLRLALVQPRPGAKAQPFFASIARQAALAGLFIARSSVADSAPTRFGSLAAADVILERSNVSRACLGFRGGGSPALRFVGLACGSSARPFGRADLACALDRLDVLRGAGDSPLTLYFARSELARGRHCQSDVLAPVKPRTTWIDPSAPMPPLKTSAPVGGPLKGGTRKL
jgi:hypothetical protein